jgi:hypothetical protein
MALVPAAGAAAVAAVGGAAAAAGSGFSHADAVRVITLRLKRDQDYKADEKDMFDDDLILSKIEKSKHQSANFAKVRHDASHAEMKYCYPDVRVPCANPSVLEMLFLIVLMT